MTYQLIHGDCLKVLPTLQAKSVDLVPTSPPYPNARTYGIDFGLCGQAWVDWMVEVVKQCSRVCRGLIAIVCDGKTDDCRLSATPALLMADLHRAGFTLRRPCIYHRVGIPGSGGPDWFRADTEFIICVAPPGPLPWSDNTACGDAPLYEPGEAMSYRRKNGSRKTGTRNTQDGLPYTPPDVANPGSLISCPVGGGRTGSPHAHKNKAPFPEALVERLILSFCRPGGTVLDPFCGSGTTIAVAHRYHRHGIGIDLQENQIALSRRRLETVTPVFKEFA
jgi:hypothetical protein